MLTDTKLRSDVEALWDKLWAGGLSNPLDAIEQLSFLLFMKRLDEREQAVIAVTPLGDDHLPIQEFLIVGRVQGEPAELLDRHGDSHLLAVDREHVLIVFFHGAPSGWGSGVRKAIF